MAKGYFRASPHDGCLFCGAQGKELHAVGRKSDPRFLCNDCLRKNPGQKVLQSKRADDYNKSIHLISTEPITSVNMESTMNRAQKLVAVCEGQNQVPVIMSDETNNFYIAPTGSTLDSEVHDKRTNMLFGTLRRIMKIFYISVGDWNAVDIKFPLKKEIKFKFTDTGIELLP